MTGIERHLAQINVGRLVAPGPGGEFVGGVSVDHQPDPWCLGTT